MDIWEKLYEKAKAQYHPEEVSPFVYAHHVVCALEAGYTPMSLDEPAQSTGRTLLDALAGGDFIDDQKLDIRLALMRLPIQQRNLIILRYAREHTQKETAKIMGVSQSQISRIERQALDALRKWLI